MNYSSQKHLLAVAVSSGLRPGPSFVSTASPGGRQVVCSPRHLLSCVSQARETRLLGGHRALWAQQPRPAEGSAAVHVKDMGTCD